MTTSKSLSLIYTFSLFVLGFNIPTWSDEIPESQRTGKSPGGGTRGDCLIVPLVPSGSIVSETRLENPTIWLYVRPSKKSTTNQLKVDSVKESSELARTIPLDKDNPTRNPTFVPIHLPVGEEKLSQSQDYTIVITCNADGDAKAINIRLASNNNSQVTNLPLENQVANLTKLNLWSEATSLLMNTPKSTCSNIKSTNDLFQTSMSNLFSKAMNSSVSSSDQEDIFKAYLDRLNQFCQ